MLRGQASRLHDRIPRSLARPRVVEVGRSRKVRHSRLLPNARPYSPVGGGLEGQLRSDPFYFLLQTAKRIHLSEKIRTTTLAIKILRPRLAQGGSSRCRRLVHLVESRSKRPLLGPAGLSALWFPDTGLEEPLLPSAHLVASLESAQENAGLKPGATFQCKHDFRGFVVRSAAL